MAIRKKFGLLFLLLILSGCMANEDKLTIKNNTSESMTEIEALLQKDQRITKAIVVVHDKEILIGINLKTFSRFNKDKIEKKLQKKIKKQYEAFDVIVSADMKIMQEVEKIVKIEDEKLVGKKIKKLKALREEET